ncbi:MAG: hypothetical protein EOO68_18545 [Moraxellaceae bacterium]|nr:MAG: hypothetical protein EOO68_18545 [Moraxellaceae bacterium]
MITWLINKVGLRSSGRDIDVQHFHMFSPFYIGSSNYATSPTNASVNVAGCMAQWKAIDQQFQGGDDGTHSQCSAGERLVGQENDPASFTPYTVNRPTKIDAFGAKTKLVTDLGSHVKGIPDFWAIDPRTFDDPIKFHNKAFGGATRVLAPATSYAIELDELSAYAFGTFTAGIVDGNLGLRVIDTTLVSHANSTSGITLANGDTTIASGKVVEEKTDQHVLPALNLAFGVTDDIKIRFGAAKTKQELDLFRYGSSLGITTAPDPADPGVRIPSEWSSDGNIDLKPWLATNYDLSAEYYVGDASLFSVSVYHIKIDSFVDSDRYIRDIPINGKVYSLDGDGPVQGKGGKVEGIELAAKVAFSDFTSNFLTDFGIDANYTYSPSEKPGITSDISGKAHPFPNNSEDTYNLVVWYQKDKLQGRVAFNHRSDRFIADDSNPLSFALYELGATYVDVNVSYDILEDVTVYLQGSNVTSTDTKQVFRLKDGVDQDAYYWDNEGRYSLGVRAKF